MPKSILILATVMIMAATGCGAGENADYGNVKQVQKEMKPMQYRTIEFATIDGDTATLESFDGKAVVIVNTASKCGYTPQYAGLQELYQTYGDSGLVVVGFPANNFGNQEPGTNEQIQEFCTSNFGVTFPMMAKVSVKGDDKHPLFVYLTEQSPMPGEIKWNFTKFVLDRKGNLVARFDSPVTPMSEEMQSAVRQALGRQG